jgi:hypothetical protein
MPQLALAGGQPIANFPQRPRRPELAEQHRYKLSPTGKAARMPFRFMFLNCLLELLSREQLEQLSENRTYSIQGGNLLGLKFGSWPNPNLNLPEFPPESES